MAVLNPRTRVVYFRISEEEFRQFCALCERRGARSLSDLARAAVQGMLQDEPEIGRDMAQKLARIDRSIAELIQRLEHIVPVTTVQDGKGGRAKGAAK